MHDSDVTIRNQYILKPLGDLDNRQVWLGNMLMPSIITKYQEEEDMLFQMNCAQFFGHVLTN